MGLLGPNGSGKSTLIDLIIGMRKPDSGQVVLDTNPRPVIGWVPQEYAFYPDLTCLENLKFFVGLLDLSRTEKNRRLEEAISSCILKEFLHKRARHCSGGVRRRLNLAIALLQQPDVLLLDEPAVGVDPMTRAFLIQQVKELAQRGTAILYATHHLEEAAVLCTDLLLLSRGRTIISGAMNLLIRHPDNNSTFENLDALFMYYTQKAECVYAPLNGESEKGCDA